MATFTRLEVWTDVACASGARVAVFDPSHLASAVLKTSLTGVESLAFSTSRTFAQAAELVHGRVVRVCWSDTTLDTEWRISEIVDQSGNGDRSQLAVSCQSILLDLARAPFVEWDSAGRAVFAFSALQLTASEWITTYVLPACVEAGMTWIAIGTQDYTTEFDLDGEYVTALELLRAMQQAGRAPGELALRRNGATDYKIDLLTARGITATTVRAQTYKNLLTHQRTRRFADLATKVIPRGAPESAVQDMSQALWRVKTVVSGTVAELEDPLGGAGPIGFDDQLDGLYVAKIASTFASQVITASVASTQRITVASTASYTAGTTLLRFYRTSGASGQGIISLSHPTRSLASSAGGFGVVTRILEVAGGSGDANLCDNAWMNTWTTSGNPPDGYTKVNGGGGATFSREASTIRLGTYSYKVVPNTVAGNVYVPGGGTALSYGTSGVYGVYTPTITPYTTAGKRYSAHAWVYITGRTNGGVQLCIADATTLMPFAVGPAVITTDTWTKVEITGVDCSSHANGVVIAVTSVPDWIAGQPYWGTPYYTNLTFYVDAFGFGESDVAITDTLYSNGTALWQRANVVLSAVSDVVTGYSVSLADLARLDSSAWSDEPLTLGGYVEIVDADLSVTTTQRVVELEQDLLNPLAAAIQLATPEALLTRMLAGGTLSSGGTISGSSGVVTTAPSTAAGRGITDVYTRAEVDALLADYPLLDGTRQFTGPIGVNTGTEGFTIGGITYSSHGQTDISVPTGLPAMQIRTLAAANCEVLWVVGRNGTTDGFADLVVAESYTGSVTVISSTTAFGTPRARTYTFATYLNLALGGALGQTYTIKIAALNTHA